MALTPEKKRLLEKIKRHRPDLIQQLRAEFCEEWRASKKAIVDESRNRTGILSGLKCTRNKIKRKGVPLKRLWQREPK